MKNLFVFSWCHLWSMGVGIGAPSYHHTINHYIESDEWNVFLFTADKTNLALKDKAQVYLFSLPEGIEKICMIPKWGFFLRTIKYWCYTWWAYKSAKKVLRNCSGKGIAYAYEFWGVKAGSLFAKRYKLPFITRFQGTILVDKKDRLIDRIKRYPEYNAIQTKADLVIMTDDGSKGDEVLKRLGNSSSLLFIRNGLDLYNNYRFLMENTDVHAERSKLGLSDNDKVCMTASRLVDWKRVDRAIYGVAEALKREPNTKLLVAGDGKELSNLRALAKKLGISKAVIFLGGVPQNMIYKYMLVSDIFLSLYEMGNLGNPIFEAMLMGKAIITLNNGGTGSVIKNEENGILLEEDQLEKLPDKIIELFEDEQKREKIAGGAFRYAEEKFYTWERRLNIEEKNILQLM